MKRILSVYLLTAGAGLGAVCDSAVGDWKWFNGGTVSLTPQKTVLMNGKAEGKWTCPDPNRAGVVLRWNAGFVDSMTVSGNRMTGRNQQGITVTADRKVKGSK